MLLRLLLLHDIPDTKSSAHHLARMSSFLFTFENLAEHPRKLQLPRSAERVDPHISAANTVI